MIIKNILCEICGKISSKYKCSNCLTKYCSSSCFKNHKKSVCEIQSKNIPKPSKKRETEASLQQFEYETEDTVKPGKLKLLEKDPELRNMLKNPHLQKILLDLTKSYDPASAIEVSMKEPLFTEYTDRCLALVEPQT